MINLLSSKIDAMPQGIELPRNYIGASSIGSDCLRQIWYQYKGYEGADDQPRLYRAKQIGKHFESLIIKWMRQSGINVITTQNHMAFIDNELPYFLGHIDGLLPDYHAVFDIKVIKASSFREFVSKGLKRWSRTYYGQLQAYMGMSGYPHAYLLAMNKDTAELHDERIEFDPMFYKLLQHRAEMIHSSEAEPPRAYSNPSWWLCKMCKFRRVCHETA